MTYQTYPKLNIASQSVVFTAEKLNRQFRRWMPLYHSAVDIRDWEDEELSEDFMNEATGERFDEFCTTNKTYLLLEGICTGVTHLTGNVLDTEAECLVRELYTVAHEVLVASKLPSLERATRSFTRSEWQKILPVCAVDEAWIRREAKELEEMCLDWLHTQIAYMLRQLPKVPNA